jgi:hypothetical protein
MEVVKEEVLKRGPVVQIRRSLLRRIGRFCGYGVLLMALVAVAAHMTYLFSGSGQWELQAERDGVTLYAKKTPGSTLKTFRAVFRVKASLGSVVTFMQDDNSEVVESFSVGKVVEFVSPQNKVTYFRGDFPDPLTDRDFVVRHTFVQDPVTKAIRYDLKALPEMAPRDACCVRVPRMDNAWLITPLQAGTVQIEWFIDMDVGGWVPYFMINMSHPDFMLGFSPELQAVLERPKYANARLDWITEPTR